LLLHGAYSSGVENKLAVIPADFEATSIRHSDGKSLRSFRWLVWAVSPVTSEGGG
jgi:hypothetical protein